MAVQDQMAKDAKCHRIFRHGPRDTGGLFPRDRWLDVFRAGDTAWLASIRCLVIPKEDRPEGHRPVPGMCAALNRLLATGVIVADARAGITSETPELWAEHVYNEGRKISAGLRPEHVRLKMREAAEAVRVPGLKARWHAPAMAERLTLQKAIWTGAGSIEDVRELLDPELSGASSRTLYDILDVRRPNDPGAGGRGKVRGSK